MILFFFDEYHDDGYSDSSDSDLDYFNNNVSGFKGVDFYNFLNNFVTETTKEDLNYDFNYANYCKFDNDYSITLMKQLNDNDIANHIKEITNDVTHVNFEQDLFL